jgi:hypothetical protein
MDLEKIKIRKNTHKKKENHVFVDGHVELSQKWSFGIEPLPAGSRPRYASHGSVFGRLTFDLFDFFGIA